MNRIILIGNGFDLAHGMETSYRHFIDDFWEKQKIKVISNNKSTRKYSYRYINDYYTIDSYKEFNELPDDYKGYKWFDSHFNNGECGLINEALVENKITHHNSFLENITKKEQLNNWVDIEEEYYMALKQCLQDSSGNAIKQLNKNFLIIKTALENYLKKQITYKCSFLPYIDELINSRFSADFILKPTKRYVVDNTLFLNFNFTNTIGQYIRPLTSNKVINIHGELNNPENPIIFGYGDDMDEEYKLIKKQNDKAYFDYSKLIHYPETMNYQKMLIFINSDEYMIDIMGLSCGNSDRTLLKALFEHKNCLSIRIFYHQHKDGTDDFSDKIRNISRIITETSLFEEILANKKFCVPLS